MCFTLMTKCVACNSVAEVFSGTLTGPVYLQQKLGGLVQDFHSAMNMRG